MAAQGREAIQRLRLRGTPAGDRRMEIVILRQWLWDNFGWELIDWADDDIRF